MKKSRIFQIVFEYNLLGIKGLLTLLMWLFNSIGWGFTLFFVDTFYSLYQKVQDDNYRDLTTESFEELNKSNKKILREMSESQQKYERDREIKDDSLKLLNKLIAEGLIREKDLLSLAGTSGYFQLFVYSASLNKLAGSLGLERPQRQYPAFLEKLGFVRLGKNSSFFLINKNRFGNEKLKSIKDLKDFLMFQFSEIRVKEWSDFLKQVEVVNKKAFLKLKSKSCREWGYLKYNFLLTETNMNPTNIGFVGGEYLGLGVASRNEIINSQILEKSNVGRIEIGRQLKVKIKKIIERLDISILLDGVAKADRDTVDLKQDIIKKNLGIENVIYFNKVDINDLAEELIGIGLDKRKSRKIAKKIVETTRVYSNALTELNISI